MKHLVFMKLEEGRFDEAAERDYRKTFAALAAALPDAIVSCCVRRNTLDRAQNFDVMIELTLTGPEALQAYLQHPLHKAIGARYQPYIRSIGSFDYEE